MRDAADDDDPAAINGLEADDGADQFGDLGPNFRGSDEALAQNSETTVCFPSFKVGRDYCLRTAARVSDGGQAVIAGRKPSAGEQ